MKRLIKKADEIVDVEKLLQRIDKASHELKDMYYILFDNLNALFESYPDLYKEIEMTVKLPKNEDAINVVKFDEDLHDILVHFEDKEYLRSYIKSQNPVEENTEEGN